MAARRSTSAWDSRLSASTSRMASTRWYARKRMTPLTVPPSVPRGIDSGYPVPYGCTVVPKQKLKPRRERAAPKPNRLRTERRKRGWSQYELAERAALYQPRISDYENSVFFPDKPNVERLAEAFGVPADVIFRWLLEPATDGRAA